MNRTMVHPETHIGKVHLVVSDLRKAVDYYERTIGFLVRSEQNGAAWLGTEFRDLLILREEKSAKRYRGTSGLFHFAILLPARRNLASFLRHIMETRTSVQGFADHAVSEAIYLADPDGNGIEVYADRPREKWEYVQGRMKIVTEPLDVHNLLSELHATNAAWDRLPQGTTIGHIHLQVSDIPSAERFYHEILGFDIVTRYGPSALFLSAGGYHHHIAVNTWGGVGIPKSPEDAIGLKLFEVNLHDNHDLTSLGERLTAAGIKMHREEHGLLISDPSNIRVLLTINGG